MSAMCPAADQSAFMCFSVHLPVRSSSTWDRRSGISHRTSPKTSRNAASGSPCQVNSTAEPPSRSGRRRTDRLDSGMDTAPAVSNVTLPNTTARPVRVLSQARPRTDESNRHRRGRTGTHGERCSGGIDQHRVATRMAERGERRQQPEPRGSRVPDALQRPGKPTGSGVASRSATTISQPLRPKRNAAANPATPAPPTTRPLVTGMTVPSQRTTRHADQASRHTSSKRRASPSCSTDVTDRCRARRSASATGRSRVSLCAVCREAVSSERRLSGARSPARSRRSAQKRR